MKTNLINSTFAGITLLLIAGCASTTQAPSTPPSATVSIREWSAAYYAQAEAGKGTLYYNGRSHRFTISGGGVGGSGVQKVSATGKVYNLNNLSELRRNLPWHQPRTHPDRGEDACEADEPEWRGHVSRWPDRRPGLLPWSAGISGQLNQLREESGQACGLLIDKTTGKVDHVVARIRPPCRFNVSTF